MKPYPAKKLGKVFNRIVEFFLNYIFTPIFLLIWGTCKLLTKLVTDVMKHFYGKILVPLIAIAIAIYLIQRFFK